MVTAAAVRDSDRVASGPPTPEKLCHGLPRRLRPHGGAESRAHGPLRDLGSESDPCQETRVLAVAPEDLDSAPCGVLPLSGSLSLIPAARLEAVP